MQGRTMTFTGRRETEKGAGNSTDHDGISSDPHFRASVNGGHSQHPIEKVSQDPQSARSHAAVSPEQYPPPEFTIPYADELPHPLTQKIREETVKWAESHGIKNQIGDVLFNEVVEGRTTDVIAFSMGYFEEEMSFRSANRQIFAAFCFDDALEDRRSSIYGDPDAAWALLLDFAKILLFHFPKYPVLRASLQELLFDHASNERDLADVQTFDEKLAEARRHSFEDLQLTPLGRALRDLWNDTLQSPVSHDGKAKMANSNLRHILSYYIEMRIKTTRGDEILGIEEYTRLRRMTVGVEPFLVYAERRICYLGLPALPYSLLFSPQMDALFDATSDAVAWHNDASSFYKECIKNKSPLNVVYLIMHHRKCSYTEAIGHALRMLDDAIKDVERAVSDLKSLASSKFHPAVDEYARACRGWISGTVKWHNESARYKQISD